MPIVYEVDRVRDGRSFTTRRTVAIQHGKPIFTLSASFQLDQPGIEHQSAMPDVPAPETLPTLEERLRDAPADVREFYAERPNPIDLRYVDEPRWQQSRDGPPRRAAPRVDAGERHAARRPAAARMRADLRLGHDPARLGAGPARAGPNLSDRITMASLDHAMWFQRPFRADEWLLYSDGVAGRGRQPRAGDRAVLRRDGHHLVSVVQEGMIRVS